jgi:Nickel-containing superoxide dismutase
MLKKFIKPVYAHCDVPCGIYETDTMMHAAATCKRMVEKYTELGEVDDENPESMNQAIRIVMTKEKHSQKCKKNFICCGAIILSQNI